MTKGRTTDRQRKEGRGGRQKGRANDIDKGKIRRDGKGTTTERHNKEKARKRERYNMTKERHRDRTKRRQINVHDKGLKKKRQMNDKWMTREIQWSDNGATTNVEKEKRQKESSRKEEGATKQ